MKRVLKERLQIFIGGFKGIRVLDVAKKKKKK